MEYTVLNNGIQMPMVGFGTWDLRGERCVQCVETALECGYRLIDTAQMYDNENEVGTAIRHSEIQRKELFITTKVYRPNNSYSKTRVAIEKSLETMKLDYIDLFLIHEPYQEAAEMYRAMEEAYTAGKIRAIGISNFNAGLYEKFISQCGAIPAVNQVEAHVLFGQRKLQAKMKAHGTQMEAWSPFAAGKQNLFHNQVLEAVGKDYGKTAAQIALKYLVQRGIIVIPKSANKERMLDNIALFDFTLTAEDMLRIDGLDQGKSLFGWY